jgi:hypothetical protein
LKKYTQYRNGVALFTAIAFLLIMATIMGLMLSITAQTSKRGSDIYFQEQAYMLAKSATEFALLAISGHERNVTTGCLNEINSKYMNIYDINTTIRYIGFPNSGFSLGNKCNRYIENIQTPESNGTVLIDVYVTLDAATAGTTEDIRFHRRTMQKP